MRFKETAATKEENSYDYRVEWEDRMSSAKEMILSGKGVEHYGPGSRFFANYDDAWECFCNLRDDVDYRGVKMIRIDKLGNEEIYHCG